MDARRAEAHLLAMLREAGIDPKHPDPGAVWAVFKAFAGIPADDVAPEEDGLLFQWGTYDWRDGRGERFNWSFVRQFSLYEDGEYDHMEQLECMFYFDPTPELQTLGAGESDWWFREQEGFDDWVSGVEALPAFRVPRDANVAFEAVIRQEEV